MARARLCDQAPGEGRVTVAALAIGHRIAEPVVSAEGRPVVAARQMGAAPLARGSRRRGDGAEPGRRIRDDSFSAFSPADGIDTGAHGC